MFMVGLTLISSPKKLFMSQRKASDSIIREAPGRGSFTHVNGSLELRRYDWLAGISTRPSVTHYWFYVLKATIKHHRSLNSADPKYIFSGHAFGEGAAKQMPVAVLEKLFPEGCAFCES